MINGNVVPKQELIQSLSKYITRPLTEEELESAPSFDAGDDIVGGFLANDLVKFLDQNGLVVVKVEVEPTLEPQGAQLEFNI